MGKRLYSAGLVSKPFWFLEFKKYMELLKKGKDFNEIKELQKNENIFMTTSKNNETRIIGAIKEREKVLSPDIKNIFYKMDVGNQKIINLLGILLNDNLFFEYVYTVVRNEILLGVNEYDVNKANKFIQIKSEENEEVAKFEETTKKRLASAYGAHLKGAGLLEDKSGIVYYSKIYIDYELENIMKKDGLDNYIRALKGEN